MRLIKRPASERARRTVWLDRRSIARLKAKAEPGSDLDCWLDRHEADTRHDGESLAAQIARILNDEF